MQNQKEFAAVRRQDKGAGREVSGLKKIALAGRVPVPKQLLHCTALCCTSVIADNQVAQFIV